MCKCAAEARFGYFMLLNEDGKFKVTKEIKKEVAKRVAVVAVEECNIPLGFCKNHLHMLNPNLSCLLSFNFKLLLLSLVASLGYLG
jgi:hypothetical protein